MPLTATITPATQTFTLAGDAARYGDWLTYPWGPLVIAGGAPQHVYDNDSARTEVAIANTASSIQTYDFSTVANAGVELRAYGASTSLVLGSSQADSFYLSNSSATRIDGGAGDDRIVATGMSGSVLIIGGLGNDEIHVSASASRIRAAKGDDTIYAGVGTRDTLILVGDRAEYDIVDLGDGGYRITHARGTQNDGVDTFYGVDFLEFKDQTEAVRPPPTNKISATYSAATDTYYLSGKDPLPNIDPSQPILSGVRVSSALGTLWLDDGQSTNGVPLNLDFSALGNRGVYATFRDNAPHNFLGSKFSDWFELSGRGSKSIVAGSGDDVIDASRVTGKVTVEGGLGNDTIRGGRAGDTLIGGRGNDLIEGGLGADTAVFSGAMSEYQITQTADGFTVSHIGGSGLDGVDTISGVEFFKFKDQTWTTGDQPDPVQPNGLVVQTVGYYGLKISGEAARAGDINSPGWTVELDIRYNFGNSGDFVDARNNDEARSVIYNPYWRDRDIRDFNFAGITNAGVSLSNVNRVRSDVVGTNFADRFELDIGELHARDGNDQIFARGQTTRALIYAENGDDLVYAGRGNDFIDGGAGNDTIYGGLGADTIVGGGGNDTIYGGDDITLRDRLVLSGNRADYDIVRISGGFEITHRNGGADGVDRVFGVEDLQFADQTYSLIPRPAGPLAAELSPGGVTLTVSGAGVSATGGPPLGVRVEAFQSHLEVFSLDAARSIPVSSGFAPQNFVFSGLANAGVQFAGNDDRNNSITGSRFADQFYLEGAGADVIQAGAGDDRIVFLNATGNKSVVAGAGNDIIQTGAGADRINGGMGNDSIDGGAGIDRAIFSGNFADYSVVATANGYEITDMRGATGDGVDIVTNVEFFQFKDQTIAAGDLLVL